MRIGLVIYGDLQARTGGTLYDRQLVEHLRRQGDEVLVFSLPWKGYAANLAGNFAFGAIDRIPKAGLDLLLEDELVHPSLFALNRKLRARMGAPIVAIVHHLRSSEPWPAASRRLFFQVERRYLLGVDAWVCNSQRTLATVREAAGLKRPFLVARPAGDRLGSGLHAGAIGDRARRGGALRILFLGSLTPRKGLHTLLDALEEVEPALWTLTVIGSERWDPVYARQMRRRIAAARWRDHVRMLGEVNDGELSQHLTASDVLAVPSAYEGFGIAYLEGMAFGLPALASAAGGADEVVDDGLTGYLVAPGDASALARSISTLAGDREELARMSLAARRHYERQPGWSSTTSMIRRFLVASASHAAGPELLHPIPDPGEIS